MEEHSLETRLERLVAGFPHPQLAVVPALWHVAQGGEVTEATVALVARLCQVDAEAIGSLMNSYPDLRQEPTKTAVCMGLTCVLKGAQHAFSWLRGNPEGLDFTAAEIDLSQCLGYCFAAPVVRRPDGVVCQFRVPCEALHE
jgi:NADH:ubiquinone oxidoreductase subunit E